MLAKILPQEMTNDEARMTKEHRSSNDESLGMFRHSCLVIRHSFVIRVISFYLPPSKLKLQLSELLLLFRTRTRTISVSLHVNVTAELVGWARPISDSSL